MPRHDDEGPVYYREILKNAYLKRIPEENATKLIPIGHKKPPLRPMWTLFCVHNGRTPYLEQYPEQESPSTASHRPLWRASLMRARHVTAGVRPRGTDEHDFLIQTDDGRVRMLAPDWDSMQDWVLTLRNKLHELKILTKGENVYCAAPAPPIPRAGTRDPTSPLPPTPSVPPDRVPGIEIITSVPRPPPIPETTPVIEPAPPTIENVEPTEPPTDNIDISDWDSTLNLSSMPSTSQEKKLEPNKRVAKICGQNICLDDSILKRDVSYNSDEEFFNEIDRLNDEIENSESSFDSDFKQTVLVCNDDCKVESEGDGEVAESESQATNITVIKVSNKAPPHTAIPVMGPETEVFNFDFRQQLSVNDEPAQSSDNFVNIVNTESNTNENGGSYGTIFSNTEADYGHISLTTTVNLTGTESGLYERLCLATTSNEVSTKKDKKTEKTRKSSLPNLDVPNSSENSTYEYLFPNVATPVQNGTNAGNTQISVARVENSEMRPRPNRSEHPVLVNSVSVGRVNLHANARVLRSNIERSHSQNAYDSQRRRLLVNGTPKHDGKNDKSEPVQAKPIWKRGLTELSLLSRLRGIGQAKRPDSPTRNEGDKAMTSPAKVVPRSRPEVRVDSARRRSSSLNNGEEMRAPLRAGAVARVAASRPPLLTAHDQQIWIAWWGAPGGWHGGRTGDRVAAIRGIRPMDLQHAKRLCKPYQHQHGYQHKLDILFHRIPLGKIYVVNKESEDENIGIKLENDCTIQSVEPNSPAARSGIPPPGQWAITEVNNRPINLIKAGQEDLLRLSSCGKEVSILLQPAALIKKIRSTLKANKNIIGLR